MSIEIKNEKIRNISWVVVFIIWFKELVGRKPPDDIKVVARFNPLKSLTPEIVNKTNINNVKTPDNNLNNVETLNCEEGNFAIFSGNLVHGSASNNGDKIRFSIDFRIINREFAHLTKKVHISAGDKPYFSEIK